MDAFDKRLKRIWQGIVSSGNVSKRFRSFQLFRSWSYENGFSTETELIRLDPDGIFGEDNCAWSEWPKQDTSAVRRNVAAWDRMVDGIRQICSLPPLEMADPCPGCPNEGRCEQEDTVCKTRMRYWDAAMARLKDMEVKHEKQ